MDEVELLNRVDLIRALLDHQQKAEVNSQALELAGSETLCALFIMWNLTKKIADSVIARCRFLLCADFTIYFMCRFDKNV